MANLSAVTISSGKVGTATATDTIVGAVGYGAAQALSASQQAQARTNAGILDPGLPDGCCRLSFASTTSLILKPIGGNTLVIGGVQNTIPAAGVTLAGQTGLTAATLYYVYATASAGVVSALVLSTTGHITGSDGREYLSSGGSTPTAVTASRLVGMVYTDANGKFQATATVLGVASFFNRRDAAAIVSANGGSTSSTSAVEYSNLRVSTLVWGDEMVKQKIVGYGYNTTAGYNAIAQAYLSSNPQGPQGVMSGTAYEACSTSFDYPQAEGLNVIGVCIQTNGGTAYFTLSNQATTRL